MKREKVSKVISCFFSYPFEFGEKVGDWFMDRVAGVMTMVDYSRKETNCSNCGRNGKITRILLHHIIPRELNGGDEQSNRLPLCAACERFIHFHYSNQVLIELKERVLLEGDVQLFGVFVKSPDYVKRANVQDMAHDFEKWKSRR